MGVLQMDTVTVTVVLSGVAFLCWLIHRRRSHIDNLPPGPRGLPVIGCLHKISGNTSLHRTLDDYRKQYGDIYSFYMGPHVTIVLSGSDVIREAFVNNANYFSARPSWLFLMKPMRRQKGLLWSSAWTDVRRFAITALKDFGLGSASLEERIRTEADYLCGQMAASVGDTYDAQWDVRNAASNVICSIVFGKRFEYDDAEFRDLMKRVNYYTKLNIMFSCPNFLPWTLPTLFFSGVLTGLTNKKAIEKFILSKVKEHQLDYDEGCIRDFIDLYIEHEERAQDEAVQIRERGILTVVMELFMAGTESTATTILWWMLFMLVHPEVQQKCRQEIQRVIGVGRQARKADMGTLSYTEATLMEVQRLGATAPYTLPHEVSQTLTLGGYTFPAHAMVLANLYSTMRDPDVFPEPEVFRPERWLDENGVPTKVPEFMPFGVGKRACLGSDLARLEYFIFTVTILQRFQLQAVDVLHPPSTEPQCGITLMPAPFHCRVNHV